jgi:hypothetical protein
MHYLQYRTQCPKLFDFPSNSIWSQTPKMIRLFYYMCGTTLHWVIPENIHTTPRRKLEVNPPTPFGCPNTFTIIRNNFVSPPPPDGRNFLRGGECGSFLERPILLSQANVSNILVHTNGDTLETQWLIAFLIHTPLWRTSIFWTPPLGIPQMLMNFLLTPWNFTDF